MLICCWWENIVPPNNRFAKIVALFLAQHIYRVSVVRLPGYQCNAAQGKQDRQGDHPRRQSTIQMHVQSRLEAIQDWDDRRAPNHLEDPGDRAR
jgi:hypothetical protein